VGKVGAESQDREIGELLKRWEWVYFLGDRILAGIY
jgi:hypothetical protein